MITKYTFKLSLSNPEQTGILKLFKAGEGEDESTSFYEYDSWNQLKKTIQGKKTITYGYNGEGYRVEKEMNGKR
jgi:YD repeat-containing protein